ncbi:uroporphyrinogen III methyltransferase [Bacteroidia bacterium]|nr:uroporphyrinogen III methyltransferase [Bacteroidia bacterium]GHU66925.1 uroporphyrinogen III methyltransferase [Bacteroidia bacterium]
MSLGIKKILVSQPQPTSEKSPYFDIAEKYGVQIVFRPFIKVEQVSAKEFRAQRINILDYTAVIFTAKTAIDHFFKICEEMRVTMPDDMKYFCVSESIAVYLQKYIIYRKRKIFYPASGKVEDLVTPVRKHNKEKYLIPVSDVHKDNLFRLLDEQKINYQTVTMYRTISNDFEPDEAFDYDVLLFFSPAGIASLTKNFPEFQQNTIAIGAFGPATAQAVRDAGLRLDIEAPSPEAPSMVSALEKYLKLLKSAKK